MKPPGRMFSQEAMGFELIGDAILVTSNLKRNLSLELNKEREGRNEH
jgi:hypothetical protein